MGAPSSQAIFGWVKDGLIGGDWERLDSVCIRVVSVRLQKWSPSAVADLVELNIKYVAEHLRDELADCCADGVPPFFEIDSEDLPYIRVADSITLPMLRKLRKVDPFDFEAVCANILQKLGAQAEVTQKTGDGGVDFYAIDFDFVPDGIETPQACRAAVIGQAKRYKEGNNVHETDVRAFVGGATKAKHDLVVQKKIFPLSPVVYAFWTTSDFDPNAKMFCRSLGLWYLGGRALAWYVIQLNLEPYVDSLLGVGTKIEYARAAAEVR